MNLRAEMEQAVSDVGQRHIDALLSHGVPPEAIASLGARQPPFGVALVSNDETGRWWPDDHGTPWLIVPCIERGDIVDLIALKPSAPDNWLQRTGAATILGADLLATCVKDCPLEIVGNPLDWLATGGNAACILNWGAAYHELSPLRDWPELQVDSPRLQRLVRQYLMHPMPIPKITIKSKGAPYGLAA